MLTILHGDNELQREEALAAVLKAADLPPDLRDLNTEILTAPVTVGDLRRACSVIPFLGGTRIVIVRNALGAPKDQTVKDIGVYIADVPPTTHLIFVEEQGLPAHNPVIAAAKRIQEAHVERFELPKVWDLPRWIQERTKQHKGRIDPQAAAVLAQNIGPNLRLVDQEIQKLLLYCGEGKPITVEDVQVMVPYVQSADVIFNMVDALGQRDPREAARYLHRLLDTGEHPLGIFGMVVRQFRLLIQVRWLADRQQTEPEIASRLKLHPYVAQKIRTQASYFAHEQLRAAYRLLTETDIAIKRGEIPADTALDLLVAQLTSL